MVKLNPQDAENRQTFSTNLNRLMKKNGIRQIDIHRSLDIPKSTITGYVKGTSLPNRQNIEKLAKFFHVDKSEIDPRFSTETEEEQERTVDLEKDPVVLSYGGKPVSEEDMQIIKAILERHKDEGNN